MSEVEKKLDYLKAKSVHIFGWPFLVEEADTENVNQTFGKKLLEKGWKKKETDYRTCPQGSDEGKHLFMLEQYLSVASRKVFLDKESEICEIYEYPLPTDGDLKYYIKADKEHSYELPIYAIEVHLYYCGAGIMFFHMLGEDGQSKKKLSIEDIKIINDKGRRIGMPFIPSPAATGYMLCADKLGIYHNANGSDICFRDMAKVYEEGKLNSADLLSQRAPFLDDILNCNLDGKGNNDLAARSTTDDRMFVFSLIRDNELSEKIKRNNQLDVKEENELYSIIYVDEGDSTCQSGPMRKDLLEKACYSRWEDWGTLYAVTNYSCMCITSESDRINSSVVTPFIEEYKYMLSLVLAQKVGIFHFSVQAGKLSGIADKKVNCIREYIKNKNKSKSLANLYERYVEFKNQIMVLEASCQEQGIELYSMLKKQLLIETEKEIFDEQLTNLYEIVNINKGNRLAEWSVFWAWVPVAISAIGYIIKLLIYCFEG